MGVGMRDMLLLGSYCVLIFYLSNQPTLPTPVMFVHQDKAVHFLAYAVMGLLAWRLFAHHIAVPIWIWFATVAFCSLYGMSDEYHQSFVDGRTSEVLDWLADTLGAAIAGSLMWYRYRFNASRE